MRLPQPVLLLVVVDEGTLPAVESADGGDGLLLGWGDETVTTSHLEILLATKGGDELTTDVMLHVARHLMIEVRETTLHDDPLVPAEHLTLFPSHLRIAGVDAVLCPWRGVGILSNEPAQTLFTQRTTLNETY